MPRIFELDPHVADLIAAGEVVERPASVVKELMENSIDAGAGIITVEITAGGMTYIRVTDNGCGINPGDVKTAFLRHATSKLRNAEGLESIGTLGFRGEALAAIAAVSRIELLTRETGADEGVGLSLEAGQVRGLSPAGCPEGTTIIVRDLFFNTPARLKFMKSDRAESSGAASAALRCALAHPETSVRFIRDGKTEFHTPGDSRVDSCIYSLFGRDFSAGLVKAASSDESVAVTGYISRPAAARGNRSYQYFFVNGRPIRSITLQAALERAFENTLPSGRFPSCLLYITTSPGSVDVNVHPAKTEVKFVSDKQVFDGVYYAALGALERERKLLSTADNQLISEDTLFGPAENAGSPEPSATGSKATWQYGRPPVENTGIETSGSGFRSSGPLGAGRKAKSGGGFRSMQVDEYHRKYNSGDSGISGRADRGQTTGRLSSSGAPSSYVSATADPLDSGFPAPVSELPGGGLRVIGEALGTYIIVEYRGSLWLIDKHAAHERIHFDALKSGGFEPMSQMLITPVICRHGREDVSLLLENHELLDKLGFTVESFGDDAVAVRRIPADIDIAETEAALSEICNELDRGGTAGSSQQDNIYRTIACKAAIKAGKSSGRHELEALASRVMSGQISHCPHGRPVAIELTKTMLDKSFKRI